MKDLEFHELLSLMDSISKLYYMSVSYDCTVEDTDSEQFHKGGCTGLFLDINDRLKKVIEERDHVSRTMLEEHV